MARVNPDAIEQIESGGNPNAVSSKGAIGLNQLMPATARAMGYTPEQMRDPTLNREARDKYIKQLEGVFGSNELAVAAAYNAGPGRIKRVMAGESELPAETGHYLAKYEKTRDSMAQQAPKMKKKNIVPDWVHSLGGNEATDQAFGKMEANVAREDYDSSFSVRANRTADAVNNWVDNVATPAAGRVVKGAGQLGLGVLAGTPPGAAIQAGATGQMGTNPTSLLHGIGRAMGTTPARMDRAIAGMDPAGKAMFAGMESAAEFVGIGKAVNLLDDVVLDTISPLLRNSLARTGLVSAIKPTASEIGGYLASTAETPVESIVGTGAKAAAGKTAKTLAAKTLTGGAVGGLYGVGEPLLEGKRPKAGDVAVNVGVGMLMGAAGGIYGEATKGRVVKNMPNIFQAMTPEDKATIQGADQLTGHMEKHFPGEGFGKVMKLARGQGTDGESFAFRSVVAEHPELANNKFVANIVNLSRDYATPEVSFDTDLKEGNVRITYENGNRETNTTVATPRQQDRFDRLAKDGQIYIKKVEGSKEATSRYVGATQKRIGAMELPSEDQVNETLNRIEGGTFVDGLFQGKKGIVPDPSFSVRKAPTSLPELTPHEKVIAEARRKIGLGIKPTEPTLTATEKLAKEAGFTPIKVSKPPEVTPLGPEMAVAAPPTAGGTPIATPGTEAVLPPSTPPETGIPEAPQFSKPAKLDPVPKAIMERVATNDTEMTGRFIKSNATNLKHFLNLVTTGVLKPENVTDHEMAGTLGDILENAANATTDTAKANQLDEHAAAFQNHSLELQGKSTIPTEAFNREPVSGDIVRSVPHDDGTTTVVDKQGRAAVLNEKDVPNPNPAKVVVTPVKNAETAKKLEQALSSNEKPVSLTPTKKFKPGERGSISGKPLRVETTNPEISKRAALVGSKVYTIGKPANPDFYEIDGARYKTLPEVFDHMSKKVTLTRMSAEQEQVIASDKISIPMPSALSRRLAVADTLSQKPEALARKNLPGQSMIDNLVPTSLRTGKAVMMSMGPQGRQGAALADLYSGTVELTTREDAQALQTVLPVFKQHGATVRTIENGTAHPEALAAYNNVVLPILNRHFSDAKMLGIAAEEVVDKVYVPHYFDIKYQDIPEDFIRKMQAQGIEVADEKHAAELVNNPDLIKETAGLEQANSPSDRLDKVKWLRQQAAALAGTLSKDRKNNHLYIDDLGKTLDWAFRNRNRRLAEAAVFGKNLERINNLASQIHGNPSVARESAMTFLGIMNDVRGKVHIPLKDYQTLGMDLARGNLFMSAPKHLVQGAMLFSSGRFGGAMRGSLETLRLVGDTAFGGGLNDELLTSMDSTRFDITEGERWTGQQADEAQTNAFKSGMRKFAKGYGTVGSTPLHMTINTIRKVAGRMGATQFDALMEPFMKGDKNATALMQDVLKFKVTPETMATLDRAAIKDMFIKNTADWAGFTFRPQDMPMLARSPMGRMFLQFRTYMWQMSSSVMNEMFNKNIPRSIRAKSIARMMLAIPAVTLLDAKLRKKVGADTVSSGELIDAFDRMTNNPKVSSILNYEVEGWVNSHALGMASEYISGANSLNKDIAGRPLRLEPAAIVAPANAAWATWRTIGAVESGNQSDKEAAVRAWSNVVLGGAGVAVGRALTNRPQTRIPKRNLIREGLEATGF